ncbi:MAG: universal stress protein [Tepidisphaeraceae bacterium]
MFDDKLVRQIHEFLDAEAFLEILKSRDAVSGEAADGFVKAKDRLKSMITTSTRVLDRPLIEAAHAYVHALERFHEAAETEQRNCCTAARLGNDLGDAHGRLLGILHSHDPRPGVQADRERPPRILVAVDDTAPSEWAMQAAIRLAKRIDAELRLVYVVPPLAMERTELITYATDLDAADLRYGQGVLARMRCRVPIGMPCEQSIQYGDPATKIVGEARRWHADYIVIGTRGHGRLARFILGSTADAVIRVAPCAVVTVGQPPQVVPDTSARAGEKVAMTSACALEH